MLRICYNRWGRHREISGRQALYRGRWPQDERGLKEIASGRNITLSDLVTAVDSERRQGNLSSAIRLFVLDFYRNQLAHIKNRRDDAGGHFAMKAGAVMQSA